MKLTLTYFLFFGVELKPCGICRICNQFDNIKKTVCCKRRRKWFGYNFPLNPYSGSVPVRRAPHQKGRPKRDGRTVTDTVLYTGLQNPETACEGIFPRISRDKDALPLAQGHNTGPGFQRTLAVQNDEADKRAAVRGKTGRAINLQRAERKKLA